MLRDWFMIALCCALLLLAMCDYARCEETNQETEPGIWCGNFLLRAPDGHYEVRQICMENNVIVFIGNPEDEPFIDVNNEEMK